MANIGYKILEILMDIEIRYKGGHRASLSSLCEIILGQKSSVQTSLTRLRRKGFIRNDNGGWVITEDGRRYLDKVSLKEFESPFDRNSKKDLLLMFDVPEECR